MTPAVPGSGPPGIGWSAALGVIALAWVAAVHAAARSLGIVERPPELPVTAPVEPRELADGGPDGGGARAGVRRGRLLFGRYWAWTVLTAFIVLSRNSGRGDVALKSVLRIAGAAAGTIAATLLAGALPPAGAWSVVAIFAVLGVASWLRDLSYAFWAAGMTTALALLYASFGVSGSAVLGDRLTAILVGAAIGVAAAWFVLPIRTIDVLRRRRADVLAALTDVAVAMRRDPAGLRAQRERFEHALDRLEAMARPLVVHRALSRPWRRGPHPADVVDALVGMRAPVAAIERRATAHPELLAAPAVAAAAGTLARDVVALRRRLAGRAPEVPRADERRGDQDRQDAASPARRTGPTGRSRRAPARGRSRRR